MFIFWPFGIFIFTWYILWAIGMFCGHLVYFPLLACCTKKNLATLLDTSPKFKTNEQE
jgi:phosphotransferase system  glucose/maltose/N-acetylglucosamine-specific IIC component